MKICTKSGIFTKIYVFKHCHLAYILAVLSSLSCPILVWSICLVQPISSCPVSDVLYQMSCSDLMSSPSCPAQATLSNTLLAPSHVLFVCPGSPVQADLSVWPVSSTYPDCPVRAVLSQMSYPNCRGRPIPVVLSILSVFSWCPIPMSWFSLDALSLCPDSAFLSWLSCLSRLVPAVLTRRLFCPGFPIQAALSRLSCSIYLFLAALPRQPCPQLSWRPALHIQQPSFASVIITEPFAISRLLVAVTWVVGLLLFYHVSCFFSP